MSSRETSPAQPQIFGNPRWLGFRHDGYEVVPLAQYLHLREQDVASTAESKEVEISNEREMAASMQSMLTFGLLEAVTEQHIPENRLITSENGNLVLRKNRLPEMLAEWIVRVQTSRQEELGPWLERVNINISQAHSTMLVFMGSSFRVFKPLGKDALSMVCLAASIGEALVHAKKCFPPGMPQEGFSWSIWIPPYEETLKRHLTTAGWCPSIVAYLIGTLTTSALEYVSAYGPVEDDKCHDACSTQVCATYVVDETNYRQKHTTLCESSWCATPCEWSRPPLGDMKQCIAEGQVPVVTIIDDASHARPARVRVQSSSEVPYVAISHVWADGLGSTTETGLPSCQLRRLASLVSKIQPGAAIWIDSLCIPQADQTRKLAIGLMARTYSQAAAVLVLDDGLQLCDPAAPHGVKLLRVLTSGWMRRLWTLQEAVLGKVLHLVLSDSTLLPLKDLMPSPVDMLLAPHLADLAGELFRLTKLARFGEFSIGDVARSLQWRTTNRPSDETLAVASLLGVDPAVLVDVARPQDRMVHLLRGIGRLPSNIIFLSGAKLDVSGLRWAPVSFMSAHGGRAGGARLSTQQLDATLTTRGLEARYHVIGFARTTFEPGACWTLENRKSGRMYAVGDPMSKPESYTCNMLLLPESIPRGGVGQCAAVLTEPRLPTVQSDGSFTVDCEYQKKLIIQDRIAGELAGDVLSATLSGRLSVCVS